METIYSILTIYHPSKAQHRSNKAAIMLPLSVSGLDQSVIPFSRDDGLDENLSSLILSEML